MIVYVAVRLIDSPSAMNPASPRDTEVRVRTTKPRARLRKKRKGRHFEWVRLPRKRLFANLKTHDFWTAFRLPKVKGGVLILISKNILPFFSRKCDESSRPLDGEKQLKCS